MQPNFKVARTAIAALIMAGAQAAAGERPVEAAVAGGPLGGMLALPDAAAPSTAVIIIPGSGPTDRDGNNPFGVRASSYRMLAEALARAGIASIRIDKRGMFASTGDFGDPNAVSFDDYAADAWAWIDVAHRETGAACAWLAGHSEGGVVALVAAREVPGLCGLVLLASPGRRMSDVLRDQLRSNPANWTLLPKALAAIDALERGERVDVSGYPEALLPLFHDSIQDFLIDAFSRDPAALVAATNKPVLIVQGGNDIQVKRVDAEALSKAQPAAELLMLPAMNHVLKDVPANDPAANYAAYLDPDLPLADGLVDAIAGFVARGR